MKNLKDYIIESFNTDTLWGQYQQAKKKDNFLDKVTWPNMAKDIANDDMPSKESFVKDIEQAFKDYAQDQHDANSIYFRLTYLFDKKYNIRVWKATDTNGGYGHKGANSKPYKLVIVWSSEDRPRKKYTFEDASIDWGFGWTNKKGNGYYEDNEPIFWGVKNAKEWASKLYDVIDKKFGNN